MALYLIIAARTSRVCAPSAFATKGTNSLHSPHQLWVWTGASHNRPLCVGEEERDDADSGARCDEQCSRRLRHGLLRPLGVCLSYRALRTTNPLWTSRRARHADVGCFNS
jgi:hypothetical protein